MRTMQISCGSVETVIRDYLKMSKVFARRVPRNLTDHDRARRVTASQKIVDVFESDPVKLVWQIVTGNETWVHHWDPESKVESMQWRHASSLSPRKFRTLPLLGNSWRPFLGQQRTNADSLPASQDYSEWTVLCQSAVEAA